MKDPGESGKADFRFSGAEGANAKNSQAEGPDSDDTPKNLIARSIVA